MNKTTNEIRSNFLNFFKKKGHIVLPSSSLVPHNDNTLLFTNAGMNQFKDIFLNEKKRPHPRVTTVQRCLRTGGKHNDIENVGYTTRHHTFFEMLGNFSFNDYFKKEAIMYAWELLTSPIWFNIPKKKLWISVYKDDKESYEIWNKIIEIPPDRIIIIGDKDNIQYNSDNFWQMGDTGPCGPCTEIFYDCEQNTLNHHLDTFEKKQDYLLEIWNIVFIEFNRISDTKIIPLSAKSIDTGMGLERIASVLQNVLSNYKIDIFQELIKSISYFSPIKDLNHPSFKIIADHIRSCAYLISDNIIPSNEHRGYVLRRIIRRALRHGHKIGIKEIFFYKLIPSVIKIMEPFHNKLNCNKEKIENILKIEEIQFTKTLDKGLKLLKKEIQKTKNGILNGDIAFYLYDTFGFPIDLTADVCYEHKIKINYQEYNQEKEKQKKKSSLSNKFYKNYNEAIILNNNDTCYFQGYQKYKTHAVIKTIFIQNKEVKKIEKNQIGIIFLNQTSFYAESGGQIGDIGKLYNTESYFKVEDTKKYGNTIGHIGKLIIGKMTINDHIYSKIDTVHRNNIQLNHTATHLLHAALRCNLGDNVAQKGSLVTDKYLRFDFSYPKHINLSQLQKIEKIINLKIQNNILITSQEISLKEAKKRKAISLFEYSYKPIVRVISINDFSIELCGGTHATRTGDLGYFKIISYSSIASGIKRIEAITGESTIDYLHKIDHDIQDISLILKSNNSNIKENINKLIIQIYSLEKQVKQLQDKTNKYQIKKLIEKIEHIQDVKILIEILYENHLKTLRTIINQLKNKFEKGIILFINKKDKNITAISYVSKNLINCITAKKIIQELLQKTHGKGGGNNEMAEGGGINIQKLPLALQHIKLWIHKKILNQ
ncbi:alanine--tRNA ligase [Buchnera aphidicola]|uniref:alanine--tRNA ligase n=1 Tax=Buchnera aphidicola TaxID=9 RepID=UPI003BEEE0DD